MKFSTIFAVASSVAAVAHGSSELDQPIASQERGLATLAEKWALIEPTFTFEGGSFQLAFDVTDYIVSGQAQFSLWKGDTCKEGNDPLEVDDSVWSQLVVLVENENLLDANDESFRDDSAGYSGRLATVIAAFDPQEVSGSDIYTDRVNSDGTTIATISFCIRFGLWTTTGMGVTTPVEVNFLETIVTLFVDLTDGFQIQDISVTPKDRLIRTSNEAYEVRGFLCSSDGGSVETAINQGSVVTICVTPEDDALAAGIYMQSIDSFTFTRPSPTGGPTITQAAIVNKDQAGNLLTTYDKPGCVGKTMCPFSTILFAQFYVGEPGVVGTVSGQGTATLQFGTIDRTNERKLRGVDGDARALQEEGAGSSEFDLSFGVNPATPRGEDSAAPSSSMMAMVLSLGAAVASAVAMI